jgi:hypothetical protein
LNELTGAVQQQLQDLVYEIDKADVQNRRNTFLIPVSNFKKILLFIPGMLGALFHLPFYLPIKKIISTKTSKTGHFDSVIVGLLTLGYPLYLLFWALMVFVAFGGYWCWLVFILLPFFAWSYVQIKQQMEK